MQLTLKDPFQITARLMAGLKVGDCTISMEYGKRDADGRQRYIAWFDFDDGKSVKESGLQSGCGGGTLQRGFEDLLDFLAHVSESEDAEDNDLFKPRVMKFARAYGDELSALRCELEENNGLIVEKR